MADFNTELQTIYGDVKAFVSAAFADAAAVLKIAEEDLPKVQTALGVVASLTALIPGIGGYVVAAEGAVTFVEDLVVTAEGVLMKLTEATAIGVAATATPATDAQKRGKAVEMLQQSFPDVPVNTHDIHVGIQYALKAKIGATA